MHAMKLSSDKKSYSLDVIKTKGCQYGGFNYHERSRKAYLQRQMNEKNVSDQPFQNSHLKNSTECQEHRNPEGLEPQNQSTQSATT
jgi:hypothetical protein